MIKPAMLASNDMFDLKAEDGIIVLMTPTVFAPVPGALAHSTASFGIHYDAFRD